MLYSQCSTDTECDKCEENLRCIRNSCYFVEVHSLTGTKKYNSDDGTWTRLEDNYLFERVFLTEYKYARILVNLSFKLYHHCK